MARVGTIPIHRDFQPLGLQAKHGQFRVAVLILAWMWSGRGHAFVELEDEKTQTAIIAAFSADESKFQLMVRGSRMVPDEIQCHCPQNGVHPARNPSNGWFRVGRLALVRGEGGGALSGVSGLSVGCRGESCL